MILQLKVILAKVKIKLKFNDKIPNYIYEIKDNADYFNHVAYNCGYKIIKYIPSEYQSLDLCMKIINRANDIQYVTNWDTMNLLVTYCPYMIDFCNKKHLSYDALVSAIRYDKDKAKYIDYSKLSSQQKQQIKDECNV